MCLFLYKNFANFSQLFSMCSTDSVLVSHNLHSVSVSSLVLITAIVLICSVWVCKLFISLITIVGAISHLCSQLKHTLLNIPSFLLERKIPPCHVYHFHVSSFLFLHIIAFNCFRSLISMLVHLSTTLKESPGTSKLMYISFA